MMGYLHRHHPQERDYHHHLPHPPPFFFHFFGSIRLFQKQPALSQLVVHLGTKCYLESRCVTEVIARDELGKVGMRRDEMGQRVFTLLFPNFKGVLQTKQAFNSARRKLPEQVVFNTFCLFKTSYHYLEMEMRLDIRAICLSCKFKARLVPKCITNHSRISRRIEPVYSNVPFA